MYPKLLVKSIFCILLLATGYFLLGMAGLKLALSPGYASAVFPAAGLALAVILHAGLRLLPGVWLGAFALNICMVLEHGGIEAQSVLVASLIATGASLQVWLSVWLLDKRLQKVWLTLDNDIEIIGFLFLAGLLDFSQCR
jgi:integral membrane sensor domain MASE1